MIVTSEYHAPIFADHETSYHGDGAMKRKPKWWNVDWVELGCRGWDIDVTGAGLGEEGEFDWDHAHLDRDTLHLILCGEPSFVARVLSDMIAAGVLQNGPQMTWLSAQRTSPRRPTRR